MKRSLLAALWLACCSCSGPERPNVLLISIDTLRADHLGSYGFEKKTTPNLDALARQSVRFDTVWSPAPLTLPAHTSMLTGTIPPTHGIHDNLSYRLAEDRYTLAELLKDAGYTTGAIVSSFVLDSQFNLDQGFDTYDDDFREEHKIAFLSERKGDETTALALNWLDAHYNERFFLFLHYYDPHDDYDPPEPFAARFPDDPYSGEIAFTDSLVGKVLAKLDELGIDESTLIVVTSDHGEMLGEHGELTHGYFIYRNALRVPLLIKAPGIAPTLVNEAVGLIDITPTIAGLLELELPVAVDGRDLSSRIRGAQTESARRAFYSESITANRYYDAATLVGLVQGSWKYVHTTRPELYDLANDPEEISNVLEEHPPIARGMKESLEASLRSTDDNNADATELDDAARNKLASLGYLSGGAGAPKLTLHSGKDDPKDWIGFYRRHQELEKSVNEGAYERARELASNLVNENPRFAAGYLQLARIATETRDLQGASTHYEKALELDPGNAGAHFNLANILRTLGRTEEARDQYETTLALEPDFANAKTSLEELRAGPSEDAQSHHRSGLELRNQGKLQQAQEQLRRAVALEPGFALAENDLGVTLKQMGRVDEALIHYRRALEIDPRLKLAHNNIGSLLGSGGDVRGALEHFRQAVAIDPGYGEAQNNLGLALRMTGARDEAMPHFRAALKARGNWPVPLNELAWILATHPNPEARNPEQAVELAEQAVRLTGRKRPVMLDTLATAYAASGDFERAVQTAEEALSIASSRAPRLEIEIERRLSLYRQRQLFIEPARIRAAPP